MASKRTWRRWVGGGLVALCLCAAGLWALVARSGARPLAETPEGWAWALKNAQQATAAEAKAEAAAQAASALERAASAHAHTSSAPWKPPTTDAERIQMLEDAGEIPRLDRSDSLAGPDVDGNGVRDDIDAWIARKLPPGQQRVAVTQLARAMQATVLVDVEDGVALRRVTDLGSHAVSCVHDAWGADTAGASSWVSDIESMTTSTKKRLLAYLAYDRALSGKVISMPTEANCD